ncbi:MAG: DUF302 domain-containing protein [Campylobacterales bacterium]|nr:DUF302 domain-containing protein [Campylobacterales bacterium]
MKFLVKSLVVLSIFISSLLAQDIQIYTADNSAGKITPATIEKAFVDAGFYITTNNDMNRAFNSKYQTTNHKLYHLIVLHKEDLVSKLINTNVDAALISPLSMSIYTNNGSNDISVSSISLDGMSKVTGISKSNKDLVALSNAVKDVLKKALPGGSFEKLSYKILKPEGELVTRFSWEMEASDKNAIDSELEGFQEEIEGSLETGGFVIAGFNKLGENSIVADSGKYDFFDAYSICKIPVIFEVAKTHPEAGAFAPCTFYMYKKKGSSTVNMAFPSVYNWISSLDIKDAPSKQVLYDAQKLFVDTVNETIE